MSGVLRLPGPVFVLWALVGAVLWTPTIVLLTAALGEVFVARISPVMGARWLPRVTVAIAVLMTVRVLEALSSQRGRSRFAARLARSRRWEFWPMWIFYAPVAAWVAILALWHRGLSTVTAANPGMPDGGTVGESKVDILQKLPGDVVIPSASIAPGAVEQRVDELKRSVDQ